MYEEIFIAGSGGQGVLSLGKILTFSAIQENKFATYYPSYGAEIRGGTANCMVKISNNFIYSPIIENPTVAIIMNMPSYLKFVKKFIPQKFLFLNTSLIEEQEEIKKFINQYAKNLEVIKVAATEIANKIGNTLVSNIVMLGALIHRTKIIDIYIIKKVLSNMFNKKNLTLNLKALDVGYEI
ncbi:MAG: 2-oxoacid:acceptor oxidoreductase family protein [Endomicrobiia bacterium]